MNAMHEAIQEAEVRHLKEKNKKLRQKLDAVKKENARLVKEVCGARAGNKELKKQNILLALLASEKPEFNNPMTCFYAKELRDKILIKESEK